MERTLPETANVFSLVVERELGSIIGGLRALATSPAIDARDFATFHAQALELLKNYPNADIIMAGPDGQQMVNTYLKFGTPLPRRNVPERVRRLIATGRPIVSNLFQGAVTKRYLVSIDVPVFEDGRVAYDLALTLPAAHFTAVLNLPNLPPDWIATILDNTSTVLARTRAQDRYIGRRIAVPPLQEKLLETREGPWKSPTSMARRPTPASGSPTCPAVDRGGQRAAGRHLYGPWRWLLWTVAGIARWPRPGWPWPGGPGTASPAPSRPWSRRPWPWAGASGPGLRAGGWWRPTRWPGP